MPRKKFPLPTTYQVYRKKGVPIGIFYPVVQVRGDVADPRISLNTDLFWQEAAGVPLHTILDKPSARCAEDEPE